jgi:hypothetical protein
MKLKYFFYKILMFQRSPKILLKAIKLCHFILKIYNITFISYPNDVNKRNPEGVIM